MMQSVSNNRCKPVQPTFTPMVVFRGEMIAFLVPSECIRCAYAMEEGINDMAALVIGLERDGCTV